MNPRDYLKKWTPGGSQTRSKRDLFERPLVLSEAQGAYVWDDADQYIMLDIDTPEDLAKAMASLRR